LAYELLDQAANIPNLIKYFFVYNTMIGPVGLYAFAVTLGMFSNFGITYDRERFARKAAVPSITLNLQRFIYV